MKKRNFYLFIIILLSILVIILSVLLLKTNHTKSTVYATVSYLGNHYILATASDNQEYKISTNQKYELGDQISFDISNQKQTSPIEGKVSDLKKLNENIFLTIEDNDYSNTTDSTNVDASSTHSDTTKNTSGEESGGNESNQNSQNSSLDANVVAYLENVNQEVEKSSKITPTIKEGFVKVVDFLFYQGTIHGRTFEELSDSAKLKALKLFYAIDSKIETKFPGYKEEIKDTSTRIYSKAKEKTITTYLEITTRVCKDNAEVCQTAKEDLKEMKKSFSLTWDVIKNIGGVGLSKLKSWYEIWRETND